MHKEIKSFSSPTLSPVSATVSRLSVQEQEGHTALEKHTASYLKSKFKRVFPLYHFVRIPSLKM